MKRGLAVAAGLLAVAVLCVPWVLGARSQAVYETALTRLREQGVRVLDSRYRRGWFASNGSVRIELNPGAAGPFSSGPIPVRIESRIGHGPWSSRAPRLTPAAALIESRVQLALPGLALTPLLVRTRVELDGGGRSRIRVPAVSRKARDARLEIAPGGGELRFTPGFAAVAGRLELPGLSLSIQDLIFVDLEEMRVEGRGSRWIGGLFTGAARLTLQRSEIRAPATSLIADGLSAQVDAAPEADLLRMDLNYRIADLRLDGAAYGASRASISLRRFPGDALESLRRAAAELHSGTADASMYAVAMATILARHLPGLLAADPELALERVEIGTPEGRVRGRLSLASRGLTPPVLQRPVAWLEHLVGEGELSLPRTLVLVLLEDWQRREVPQRVPRRGSNPAALPEEPETEIAAAARDRLDWLVRHGWLAQEGEGVTAVVRLADGLLTINGKTIPVGAALP